MASLGTLITQCDMVTGMVFSEKTKFFSKEIFDAGKKPQKNMSNSLETTHVQYIKCCNFCITIILFEKIVRLKK